MIYTEHDLFHQRVLRCVVELLGLSVVLSNTADGIFSLGRANLLLPQLRCSKKLGLWRPGPTQNAHPDVLGLL